MEWRCIVCGKKMAADHKPEACPVCGVDSEYIVSASEYVRPSGAMSETAASGFGRALELEVEATRIYEEIASQVRAEGDELTATFFEALAKNERGHQVAIKYQQALRKVAV